MSGLQESLLQNPTKMMKKNNSSNVIFHNGLIYQTYKFCEHCLHLDKCIKNFKSFRSKRLIWSPCSEHAVVEGKISLNLPDNKKNVYFVLTLKLPGGGGQMALPLGIWAYGSQMKKMWYLECM